MLSKPSHPSYTRKNSGVLKENKKLVVFPEGTRHKDKVDKGELGETKNGVAMFAIKGKAPIVPVWINRNLTNQHLKKQDKL